jgi:hypothetical protein
MNIERENDMTRTARKPVDLSYVEATIAKLSEATGLEYWAAHNFRIIAHTVISRGQTAYVGTSAYGEGIQDEDQAMVDAGLITLGRFEANRHPMALSNCGDRAVILTDAGRSMVDRVIRYETTIRARNMDADDFAAWKRAVSSPL